MFPKKLFIKKLEAIIEIVLIQFDFAENNKQIKTKRSLEKLQKFLGLGNKT